MFWFRDTLTTNTSAAGTAVHVAFTDASKDLQGLKPGFGAQLASVEAECGVRFARMHQLHGADVVEVSEPAPPEHSDDLPHSDALVTSSPGLGLMVRVADCVPVLLTDSMLSMVAAVHAGRSGVAADIVGKTCQQLRDRGASDLLAWVGPHVCGRCYEVPEELRREVAAMVPQTFSETSWGTPSLDLAAGVLAQLEAHGATATHVSACTREESALHSFRRDGSDSGRMAGLIWLEAGS